MCKIVCVCFGFCAVALGALTFSHSASGFLVLAVGGGLLLDKLVFRTLPWPRPASLLRELALRTAVVLLGGAAFYCTRFGLVPVSEALYLGVMTSLTVSGVESFSCLLPAEFRKQIGTGSVRLNPPRIFQLTCLLFFALTFPYWHTLHPMHTVPKRGPDAMGFAYEDLALQTEDGVSLSAWLVPVEQAEANVIFCHGHGRNKGHVAGLLATLHEAHCNVLAFDFRGHGDSPGHTVNFGGKDVDDLCLMVHYLEARFPGKPIVLAGISYGAAVSLEALERLPQVKGLWSEGAFGWLNHAVRRRLNCVPAFVLKPVVRMYYLLGKLDCNLWVPDINPVDCLAGVHVPILFCHGEQDELAPFGDALALYNRYRGPKWNYWIDGGSHYNLRQRHREEYLARFRRFLQDCLTVERSSGSLVAHQAR
jgi:uncharacterized protein